MSKYTTELRFICETLTGLKESVGYADTAHVIEQSAPLIFSFPFPVDDEAYRPILERKIIRHYYTREISEETYGLWKLRLETKMNEIMPYYNKLYASERLEFNPLYDVDMTTTREGENHSDTTTTENSTGTTKTTVNENTTTAETDSSNRTIDRTESNSNNRTSERTESDSNDRTINRTGTDSNNRTSERTESDSNDRTINRTENVTTSDNKWDLYSDTPQGALSNVSNREYLTNARNNTDSGSSNTSENTTDKATGSVTENTTDNATGSVTENTTDKATGSVTESTTDEASGSVTENTTDEATGTKNGTQEREGETNSTLNRESTGSGSIDSTDSYVLHVKGKQGGASYAKMIQEYRNALLNIDMMIINDLAPLFFNLW